MYDSLITFVDQSILIVHEASYSLLTNTIGSIIATPLTGSPEHPGVATGADPVEGRGEHAAGGRIGLHRRDSTRGSLAGHTQHDVAQSHNGRGSDPVQHAGPTGRRR